MLERFVRDICQCEARGCAAVIKTTPELRSARQVGHDKVIPGLSKGVDSSATAMLLHRDW